MGFLRRFTRPSGEKIDAPEGPWTPTAPAAAQAAAATSSEWRHTSESSDWIAVDLETTGLLPRTDRVIEIGMVRFDDRGHEIDAWTTLLDPMRDIGATFVHGITSRDVVGAPTFGTAASEILARMANARLACHNARFDLGFLAAEFARAGLPFGEGDAFCTMSVPYEYGVVENRRLAGCCAELGIVMEAQHEALSDARATGAILFMTRQRLGRMPFMPAVAPDWPPVPPPPLTPHLRGHPAPLVEGNLGALADRVGVPKGLAISDAVALAYLALLDRVLEDRRLDDDEVHALASAASDWRIGTDTAAHLHRAYVAGIGELALADGVITSAERADLARLNELLGVGPAGPGAVPAVRVAPRAESFAGRSVCFTGESVCTIDGRALSRADQEGLAADAGLVIKGNVSRQLDLLVLADPDSRSGKARKAEEAGVRRMAEPAFWRAIGVRID
jgi:DNA polymerase-3 subunit epsilon